MCALPAHVDVNGAWNDILARLYAHFDECFNCDPKPRVCGKPIVYDPRKIDDGKEEGFWHVVTRGKGEDRLFDTERARRICWIKPLLENQIQGVSRFAYTEGNGTVKLYFWIEQEDYVLILAERPRVVSLVTAFFIDQQWLKDDLAKRKAKGTPF